MVKQDIDYISNILRQGTITWRGRIRCLELARVRKKEGKYKNGKTKWKFYWKCAKCKKLYRNEKEVEADHIIEIGSFKGDWNDFILRMYCGQKNWQALCVTCHKLKTSFFNASIKFKRHRDSFDNT